MPSQSQSAIAESAEQARQAAKCFSLLTPTHPRPRTSHHPVISEHECAKLGSSTASNADISLTRSLPLHQHASCLNGHHNTEQYNACTDSNSPTSQFSPKQPTTKRPHHTKAWPKHWTVPVIGPSHTLTETKQQAGLAPSSAYAHQLQHSASLATTQRAL